MGTSPEIGFDVSKRVKDLNNVFHNVVKADILGGISIIDSATRTDGYTIKLPRVFANAQTMVVENNKPYRWAKDVWTVNHHDLCIKEGIPVDMVNDSTTNQVTSGYLVDFRFIPDAQNYYFPSEARYLSSAVLAMLGRENIVVVNENFEILLPQHNIIHGWQTQTLKTIYTL